MFVKFRCCPVHRYFQPGKILIVNSEHHFSFGTKSDGTGKTLPEELQVTSNIG